MEMFKNELTVGGKAIVIGCYQPENTDLIGSVVTVEQVINDDGTYPDDKFISESGRKILDEHGGWDSFEYKNSAIISGLIGANEYYIESHHMFDQKHLMPINPDATMIEEFEKEGNPYLEVAVA